MQITTIKISKKTKKRLDKLKEHKRETYEDIMEKMLLLLNLTRSEPEKARIKLIQLGRKKQTTSKSNLSHSLNIF